MVQEATLQDHLELAKSEQLLSDAIALVESVDPYSPEVGAYSEILANKQKQ
jgi:hypothetical protein